MYIYTAASRWVVYKDILNFEATNFVFPERIHEQKRMYPNHNPACPRYRTPLEVPDLHIVRYFCSRQMRSLLLLRPLL
jgi:hypothetical protein